MKLHGKHISATLLLLAASAAMGLYQPARAAYDKPVTWSDMSALPLGPVFNTKYASQSNLFDPQIAASAYELVLRDADVRISPDFRVPPGMKEAVHFWLRIYTEWTTQHVVIFDRNHPEVVYDVLDFRDLARTSRNAIVYEILSKRRVKAALHGFRNAFRTLARNPKPAAPNAFEAKVLLALSSTQHKHSIKLLGRGLRTQTGQRDNIVKGLIAAETFLPKMEQIFTQVGVPPELTRLALVESSFNLNAISKVGASGVWQFMHKSALEYMTINPKLDVDERLSPIKSTVAAAKLLKRNNRIFKSWPLAVTSYNHGLRGLLKIPAKHRGFESVGKVFDPCKPASRLGYASRNYYAEFLAVVHAEAYRSLFYGEVPLPPIRPIATLSLKKPQSAMAFMLERGIPLHEFRFYNPDVGNLKRVLPAGFTLVVPGETDDLAALFPARASRRGA